MAGQVGSSASLVVAWDASDAGMMHATHVPEASVRIRRATVDEARHCSLVVATALLHDPVGLRAVRSRIHRLRRMTGLYEAELRLGAFTHGFVDVALDDDDIIGVAAWIAPEWRRTRAATLRQAPRYLHAVGVAHAISAARVQRRRHRARPSTSHWLLADIAVAAEARGLGIGGALLAHGLERCDAPVYLEATTPASRRLYERFGFIEHRRIDLVEGGYPVGMLRPSVAERPSG